MSGERVLVRPFEERDLGDFLAYQSDPIVRRHQHGPAMSDAEAAAFVASQIERGPDERDAWHGRVVEHVAERRVIGDLGLWLSLDADGAVVGDLGFQLDPRYHRQGYALEALQAFLPATFEEFALDRITASCDEANMGSWTLLERSGMRLIERTSTVRRYGRER